MKTRCSHIIGQPIHCPWDHIHTQWFRKSHAVFCLQTVQANSAWFTVFNAAWLPTDGIGFPGLWSFALGHRAHRRAELPCIRQALQWPLQKKQPDGIAVFTRDIYWQWWQLGVQKYPKSQTFKFWFWTQVPGKL